MKYISLTTAFVVAAALAAAPALAATKKAKHKHVVHRPAVTAEFNNQSPPRMIELRPGYWVSSWGCTTDDGYGRLRDCEANDGRD